MHTPQFANHPCKKAIPKLIVSSIHDKKAPKGDDDDEGFVTAVRHEVDKQVVSEQITVFSPQVLRPGPL